MKTMHKQMKENETYGKTLMGVSLIIMFGGAVLVIVCCFMLFILLQMI